MQRLEKSRLFLQKLLSSPPELPFESALLPMLFEVTQEDSTASLRDLVTLISRSQKLTLRVLAITNSAAYGLAFKVSTLQQAVRILGVREIRLQVILVGTSAALKAVKLPRSFDVSALWLHQLQVAAIAKTLTTFLGGPSGVCGPSAREQDRLNMAPDEAYIAGSLHDLGKPFFAASSPSQWEEVQTAWNRNKQQYFEVEHEFWSMDHAMIGARVLHFWKLPILLTETINWHHMPELAPSHKMAARMLAAANRIAKGDWNVATGLPEEALSLLPEGIDPAALMETIMATLANDSINALMSCVK